MYRLTSIQVPRFLSYFHPFPNIHASPPSRSRLTSIQVTWIASKLHHSPISPYPGLKMCITSQSRSDLTPIQVWRCASQPHPCSVPPPSRSLKIKFTKIYCVCTQFSFYKHGTPHSSELVFVMNKRFSTKSKSSRLVEIHFSLPGVGVGHCQVVTRSGTAFCRCKMRQLAISNLAMMSLCLHYLVEKCTSRRLEDNQIQNKIRLEDITKNVKTSWDCQHVFKILSLRYNLEIVNMSLRYCLKDISTISRHLEDVLKTSWDIV